MTLLRSVLVQSVLLVRKAMVWEITRGADLPTLSGGDDITVIIMLGIIIVIAITIIIIAMFIKTCRYISDKQTQISGGQPSSEAAQDTFLHQVVVLVVVLVVLVVLVVVVVVVSLVRWWLWWEWYP